MADEGQNNEISIAGEVTATGIKASIKSRAVSAWDRFFGASADKKRAPIDAEIAETNAMSEARVKMIGALGDLGVERLKADPDFATRAVDAFLPILFRRQENKEAVLELALEDLRQDPGSDEQSASGPEKLDDAFLNRFERYAEDATDEQVRERWAKVLASEIRRPGTFSGKILRVIDELDQSVALSFEKLCHNRLDNVLLIALVGDLDFPKYYRLVDAGLIVDPGVGQIRPADEMTLRNGLKLWFWGFDTWGVSVEQQQQVYGGPITQHLGAPALPCYLLTDAGVGVASILQYDVDRRISALAEQLTMGIASPSVVRIHALDVSANHWITMRELAAHQYPEVNA